MNAVRHPIASAAIAVPSPVRVAIHELPVVARPRLGLVEVHDDVGRLARGRRDERPLHTCGKPAPPRPRRPEALTVSMIAAGSIVRAVFNAS